MKTIKTILIGTSEFAERIFKQLVEVRLQPLDIVTVITAPDKPVGRKQILTPPPVKKWAMENNLPVLQPDKIKNPEWIEKIKKLKPELIILAAYSQIIPKKILDIPKFGALNIHPSLLPKYRGASPIQTAILNGDEEFGVTIIKMDEEMDHGDIVAKLKVKSQKLKITYEELSNLLAHAGAELLTKILPSWVAGKIKPRPQDHSRATYCKIIKKEDGRIDWNKSAESIERQIRAFHQWPAAYTFWNNKRLKILEAEILKENKNKKPGEVFAENSKLMIQTGDGILAPKQVQLEGRKLMAAKNFLNGHPEIIGTILK